MTDQIHGHAIIDFIGKYPEGVPVDQFAAIVAHEFGSATRFFTCSADNLTLPELLTFLAERDKVQVRDNVVFPGGSPACNHE